ncbi:MAG: hypothetical protein ACETWC_01585 [Acidobacteriota bacterium]
MFFSLSSAMFTNFTPFAMGESIPRFLFYQASNYGELLVTSIVIATLLKSWSISISSVSSFSLAIGRNFNIIDFSLFPIFDMSAKKRNLRDEANSLS